MTFRTYLRVSTDEQAASGHGMNAQLDACMKIVGDGEYQIYMDEGISGASQIEDRPGLLSLLDDMEKGDTLLVAKRDRLARDPLVIAMIEKMIERTGCKIISAAGEGTTGDGPSDILMRGLSMRFPSMSVSSSGLVYDQL
jgi:DNA invertase Pin-like site-specific DNA recombinase